MALEITKRVQDCVVYGKPSDDLMEKMIEFSWSSKGLRTARDGWNTHRCMVDEFVYSMSQHKVGDKDGPAWCPGVVVGGCRREYSIKYTDLIAFDVDVGETLEEMRARIEELGWFALIYTTHSHLKNTTNIKKDTLVKFALGNEPTLADAKRFLIEKRKFRPEILTDAKILDLSEDESHTEEGVQVFILHAPIPKYRVVLLLKDRFSFSKAAGTQKASIDLYKSYYYGISEMLGSFADKSCVDPSRLFFGPRHPEGRTDHETILIAGTAVDLSTVTPITAQQLRDKQKDPYLVNAFDMGARRGAGEYQTPDLMRFVATKGKRFEIERFLEEYWSPEDARGPMADKTGTVWRCPNDDAHGNAGDVTDAAFCARNAPEDGDKGFWARCSHNSCEHLDRVGLLDLICVEAGITNVKDLEKYCFVVEGDVDEGNAGKVEAFASVNEAQRAFENLPASGDDAFDAAKKDWIARVAASKFSKSDVDMLAGNASKKHGGRLTAWAADVQTAARDQKQAETLAKRATAQPGPYEWPNRDVVVEGRKIYQMVTNKSQETVPVELCGEFVPIGRKHDPKGGVCGVLIEFEDWGRARKQITYDVAELTSDCSAMFGRMGKEGLKLKQSAFSMALLRTLLGDVANDDRLPCIVEIQQPGFDFDRGIFVCPTGEVLGEDCAGVRLNDSMKMKDIAKKGTEEGSLSVLRACFESSDHFHYGIGALIGFAGVVQQAADIKSGGITLVGLPGYGKSTAQGVQVSHWGNPQPSKGLLYGVDGTLNSLEQRLSMGTGTTVALDEAKNLEVKDLAKLPFKIQSESSRGRMNESHNGNKEGFSWKVFCSLSTEKRYHELLKDKGEKGVAGAVRRLPEVSVSIAAQFLPGTPGWELLDRITQYDQNYGHLGPKFVQAFMSEGWHTPDGQRRLKREVGDLKTKISKDSPKKSDPAEKFAVLMWVGQALKRYEFLTDVHDTDKFVMRAWDNFEASVESDALVGATTSIEAMRTRIYVAMQTGRIKFVGAMDDGGSLHDLLGLYDDQSEEKLFYLFREKIRLLMGEDHGYQSVLEQLQQDGVLVTRKMGKRTLTYHPRIPRGPGALIPHYRLKMSAVMLNPSSLGELNSVDVPDDMFDEEEQDEAA